VSSPMPSLLPSILNLRDVGQTTNELIGKKKLQTGKLYRAARPEDASDEDKDRLVNDLKIKTVIDLRSSAEHIHAAEKHNAKTTSSEAIPKAEAETGQPFHISGLSYREISLNGWPYSRSLLSKMTWWDTAWFFTYMTLGYRVEAITILGTSVMVPEGLVGLAIRSVDSCTDELRRVFEVLAEEENYPVLVHCTQGKDRTGLVVMLLLILLGIDKSVIHQDYMRSMEELKPEREERLKEIRTIGLTDEFADCDEKLVNTVINHINDKFGNVDAYLESCGVDSEMQDALKRILEVDNMAIEH